MGYTVGIGSVGYSLWTEGPLGLVPKALRPIGLQPIAIALGLTRPLMA